MSQLDDLTRGWGRRWHYRRSLASRVTLLTTMAVGLSVAFVALGAFATVRIQMTQSLDQSLLERARKAAESSRISELISSDLPSTALGAADIRIAIITANGRLVTADDGPVIVLGDPERQVWAGRRDHSIRTVATGGEFYRVVAVPATEGQTLVIAQSLAPQEQVLQELSSVMLIFGFAGVITAALAGWIVALNGLRPVRKLTEAAETIARTEDLAPLTVEGDDEIARLASAFNTMLTALSASRDRQRQLVADAGHELRTPLTSLRTNLDLLAQAEYGERDESALRLPPEARRELLHDVRAQIEELTTLIGDLVELARDEPMTHVVEEVDLVDVIDRAVARVRRRAPGAAFDVHASPWWVYGESVALERAVTNLLDNAAKWGPDGTITVRLEGGTLTVDDEGPGISAADQPHVFERFYRSEESRGLPGSGLGLSIVAQVAERHAGAVGATTAPGGGARLSITLPGSARSTTVDGPSNARGSREGANSEEADSEGARSRPARRA
jgi:two-component system, OmpR family, sensor histidine kinase MprB